MAVTKSARKEQMNTYLEVQQVHGDAALLGELDEWLTLRSVQMHPVDDHAPSCLERLLCSALASLSLSPLPCAV